MQLQTIFQLKTAKIYTIMRIYDNKDEKIAIKDDFMDKSYQNFSGTRPKKGFMSPNTGPKHLKNGAF